MFLLHRGTEFSTKEDKIADFELAITGLPQKQKALNERMAYEERLLAA